VKKKIQNQNPRHLVEKVIEQNPRRIYELVLNREREKPPSKSNGFSNALKLQEKSRF
jgi:hypothetical protein